MKLATAIFLLSIFSLGSATALAIEEPPFEILSTKNGIEYRKYPPYLLAETAISLEETRSAASSMGFRRLFRYIRGANRTNSNSNTNTNTKIAMTAPVRQNQADKEWHVAFVLPAQFTKTSAPQPTSSDITIVEMPEQIVAVLGYSGRWTQKNVDRYSETLLKALKDTGVEAVGELTVAYYNSPFSLPFMRRNEVMVAIKTAP